MTVHKKLRITVTVTTEHRKQNKKTRIRKPRLGLALNILIPWTCCCVHDSWDVLQHSCCPWKTHNRENRKTPEEASGTHHLTLHADTHTHIS